MPRIFDVHKCKSTFNNISIIYSEWHPTFPLFAVSTANGVVTLYDDQGNRIEEANLSRSENSTSCAWHPQKALLVTGWKKGDIVLYSNEKKAVKEVPKIHKGVINLMKWSPDGSRLITCEENGMVAIWRIGDQKKLKLEKIVDYTLNSTIHHVLFKKHVFVPSEQEGNALEAEQQRWLVFMATEDGSVHMADDLANCKKAFFLNSPLYSMLYYEDKKAILALTHSSLLALYRVHDDLKMSQIMKVKISLSAGGSKNVIASWIGNGLLATSANEKMIRVWNLKTDENFVINTNTNDTINCFAYNPNKRAIAACTSSGVVYFWHYVRSNGDDGADDWEKYARYEFGRSIEEIKWGPGEEIITLCSHMEHFILHEILLKKQMRGELVAIQITPDQLMLCNAMKEANNLKLKCSLKFNDLDFYDNYMAVWNNRQIHVYELSEGQYRLYQEMNDIPSRHVAVHARGIYVANENRIEVYNFKGSRKQTLFCTEDEGKPIYLNVNGDFLVATTTNNYIKIWNILGREAKQVGLSKQIFKDRREIVSVKLNCNGTKVSVLNRIIHKNGLKTPDTHLYIYDLDNDKILSYDFVQLSLIPISHYWDNIEPMIIGIEATGANLNNNSKEKETAKSRIQICTLFATSNHGVLLHDSIPLEKNHESLVGLSLPYMYFQAKGITATSTSVIEKKALRDFEGIKNIDQNTRDALLKFSYNLTIGNMDDAYKAVKQIKDPSVWHNMAQMCVKTRKMFQVAEICLGNMQNAAASNALREAKKEPEEEARIAMLAIQLGMNKEAEELYIQCKRYDLLNKFYQSLGQWDKAIEIAEKYDRIHLRTTHYQYAKYLESINDIRNAIKHYEASRTHQFEVPRMLFEINDIKQLKEYVSTSKDPQIMICWAQYCELNGDIENAITYYLKAKDYLSVVRLHCYLGDFNAASQYVIQSGNKAAALLLARQLEEKNEYQSAIQFYTVAETFKHAIRLAIEHDMTQEVLNLALKAPPQVILEAAQYFEKRDMKDKAVLLYQKGGFTKHAIDMCFRSQLYDVLAHIAESLDQNTDPEILSKCASFFVEHGNYDKAVKLFIHAKEYEKAIDVAIAHNVILTDELVQQMPGKGEKGETPEQKQKRIELLLKIAQTCEQQGNYATATKKYVQAGRRVDAMKVLIKSGNTEKIIFFAQHSRSRELYVLAANYLQTLDWHNDPDVMNNIIQFYQKGRAYESLSGFYVACSQLEINEFRDYEKALGALKEAVKHLMRANIPNKEERVNALNNKIMIVNKFVNAMRLKQDSPDDFVRLCVEIINERDAEEAVRVGDVFAALIEYYLEKGDKERAYSIVQQMQNRGITLEYYLEKELVNKIKKDMGLNVQESNDEEEIVEEDIPEHL